MAFLKNQTILEFWLKNILNSYKNLKATRQMPELCCQNKQNFIDRINDGTIKLSLISLTKYRILLENHKHSKKKKCVVEGQEALDDEEYLPE